MAAYLLTKAKYNAVVDNMMSDPDFLPTGN